MTKRAELNCPCVSSKGGRKATASFVTICFALVGCLRLECMDSFSVPPIHRSFRQKEIKHFKDAREFINTFSRYLPRPKTRVGLKLANAAWSFETENSADFERRTNIHSVLETLKTQIPTLLSTPLTEASAKAVYDDDIQLVVEDIVLASSREELVSLSTTLVLAVLATNQANSFFSSASIFGRAAAGDNDPQQSPDQSASSSTTNINSTMAIDPSLQAIRVQWQVKVPGAGQTSQRQLQGVSELQLDQASGKVTTLRLLQVQWNGERLNARAIGESLASLRQLVFAFQDAPVLKSFLPKSAASSLSSLLGPDFMQQVSSSSAAATGQSTSSSPLFVADSLDAAFVASNGNVTGRSNTSTTNETKATADAATLTPIDEYVGNASETSLPLPGTSIWNMYVTSRQLFRTFLNTTLPVLSGNKIVPSREMLELFSDQARLLAVDRSELLRGRDQVGNFFHTVASWRKRSSGTWELRNATLLGWSDKELTIAVDYRSTAPLPGSSSPAVIEGIDHFVLEQSWTDSSSTSGSSNEDEDEMDIVIKRIVQKKLHIGGVGNKSPDGLWFMTSLVSALDTGRFSSVGGDSVVMDLLQRVIAGDITTSASGDVKAAGKRRKRVPPKLPESVAARVYNIMTKLHEEVPLLLDKENLRIYQSPPLHEFMSDDIELRGYLGEALARGSSSYNRATGTSFASLKTAQATGSVKMEQEPSISVELTAEGNVRLSLTLYMKVLPLPSGTSDLINSMSGSTISLPSGGFPLEISIVSDYVIKKETGDIYQQRLVESRINGQLTPGDVISRWIQTQVSMNPKGNNNDINGAAFQRSLLDAISWVRSMNKG